MTYKDRVKRAMEKYIAKEEKKRAGPRRRNASPEKDVAKECLEWMRSQGWDVDIYEAKATYDPRRGIYRSQGMKAGTCDCMGTMPDGTFVAVEFKAPGRLSTFKQEKNFKQKEFILKKIEMSAFACVVDSATLLVGIFGHWKMHRDNAGAKIAQDYLKSKLP